MSVIKIKDRWTLDDYLFQLFENKQTDSSEFKCLLRIYGRERIEKTWKQFREQVREPVKERFSRYHPMEVDKD